MSNEETQGKNPIKAEEVVSRSLTTSILELIKVALISAAIVIPVRYFLIQPFYVKGASMEPNFHNREYLIIDEISYRLGKIERGDAVVFRYPNDPKQFFIKRIIGLPHERVKIQNGAIYIYNKEREKGVLLKENYIKSKEALFGEDQDVGLREDEYYLLGDNRGASLDSRRFGPVNKKYLIGRVILRGFPFSRAGILSKPAYDF